MANLFNTIDENVQAMAVFPLAHLHIF